MQLAREHYVSLKNWFFIFLPQDAHKNDTNYSRHVLKSVSLETLTPGMLIWSNTFSKYILKVTYLLIVRLLRGFNKLM